MAPPMIAKKDPVTGLPKKRAFGAWMLRALALLAKFKFLRGTAFDIFGRSHDRVLERRLLADYEALLDEIETGLKGDKHALAVELAELPETIRGFGHVKAARAETADQRRRELLEKFRAPLKQGASAAAA